MTVGVLWEFFEYTGDRVMGWDMQKDTVVNSIYTVELDETRSNKVVAVKDIADVMIVHSDGSQEALGLGGYLDIGLIDTMKDLMVNFLGAVVFSIIGYFYVKEKGKGDFAAQFIPKVKREKKDEPKWGRSPQMPLCCGAWIIARTTVCSRCFPRRWDGLTRSAADAADRKAR